MNRIYQLFNQSRRRLAQIAPLVVASIGVAPPSVVSGSSKRVFSYDLSNTPNLCHVDEWQISKDFIDICKTNNLESIKKFYHMFVETYEQYLLSLSNNTMEFYDTAWRFVNKINFEEGLLKRFMNYNFRELMYCNRHISKEVIQWFIPHIDMIHYYCAFNTLCLIGDFRTAKIMYELQPFDFIQYNKEGDGNLDSFRSAAANGHLELAQWLYTLGAHHNYKYGYDNIKQIVNNSSRAGNDVKLWLNSLPEFR